MSFLLCENNLQAFVFHVEFSVTQDMAVDLLLLFFFEVKIYFDMRINQQTQLIKLCTKGRVKKTTKKHNKKNHEIK